MAAKKTETDLVDKMKEALAELFGSAAERLPGEAMPRAKKARPDIAKPAPKKKAGVKK